MYTLCAFSNLGVFQGMDGDADRAVRLEGRCDSRA